jgi:hypothetical protein
MGLLDGPPGDGAQRRRVEALASAPEQLLPLAEDLLTMAQESLARRVQRRHEQLEVG